ncbi:hypothetical protein ES703_75259 [subsurface metagenome]
MENMEKLKLKATKKENFYQKVVDICMITVLIVVGLTCILFLLFLSSGIMFFGTEMMFFIVIVLFLSAIMSLLSCVGKLMVKKNYSRNIIKY